MVGGHDGDGDQRGDASHLGECPGCGATVPRANLVIEYRTPGDWPRVLAECPDCHMAVQPT